MRKHSRLQAVALSGSTAQIIGPSEKRTALLFSPPATGAYSVSTEAGLSVLGGGLTLLPTSAPILITEEHFGDAPKKPWFGIASTGITVAYMEVFSE